MQQRILMHNSLCIIRNFFRVNRNYEFVFMTDELCILDNKLTYA